jgi:hypothetical protein
MTFFRNQTPLNIGLFWTMMFIDVICIPQIGLSNDVASASNEDSMPMLGPQEIDVPIYPNEAHILAFHLLGLGFWMFRVSIVFK